MVPSNQDGDDVASSLHEQLGDEALAAETAHQAHDLMPPEIAAKLPPLYSQEDQSDDAIAQVKFFTPWTNWTWYVTEYDPERGLCFAVVVGHERDFGFFYLEELEAIRGPGGLRIERDLHWIPCPLKECR